MSADIIPFAVDQIGDGIALDPDRVLTEAQGKYAGVVVVGETPEGEIHVCASMGAGDTLILLQWAADFIVRNRCSRG